MKESATHLIIPVENQVRELDAKLLLACFAAERGFPVILGSRGYIHYKMAAMPRGVYLAKSMRELSNTMFRIIRLLGHEIIAWDEEALVHPPAEIYFPLRLSPVTVPLVSHMICWGQENADLFRQYPHLPPTTPIHIVGNPRGDMLRPELRGYFGEQVEILQKQYGDFILVNTNFLDVNPFIPDLGLFVSETKADETPRFGQAGKGMTLEFATGLRDHKLAILHDFLKMVPALHFAFPDYTIVIRPHPSENHDIYNELAARFKNIRIDNSGNIIPWLLACKAMIHNGCTTGAEAYLLRVPAISYLATFNKTYDYDWQGLPTKLSYQCFSFDELKLTLGPILSGEKGVAGGEERKTLMHHYLAAQDGPLACERLVDVLIESGYDRQAPLPPSALSRLFGWFMCCLRTAGKQAKMKRHGSKRQAYHDHRFPELTVADVERRIKHLGKQLNRFGAIKVRAHSQHIFMITGCKTSFPRARLDCLSGLIARASVNEKAILLMASKSRKKLLAAYLNLMIIVTMVYRIIRPIVSGNHRDSNEGRVVLLISRPQDFDLLVNLYSELKYVRKAMVNFWIVEKCRKRFPDILRKLTEIGADLPQIVNYSQFVNLPKLFAQTDCFINTTECSSVQHKLPYMLTKMANAAGVNTYTIQHGFENVGLTYRDKTRRKTITFASKTVLTWGPVEELPAWVEKETLNKCVAVGCPKKFDVIAKDFQSNKEERPIIGIFDNLHWRRYDEKYVSTFLDHMEETARRRPEFRFILKSHPVSIRKRSKELTSRLSNMGVVEIADLLDNNGQELTTPWLLSNALGVITTPSTIALDSAMLGVPVAVTRYGLDLSYYTPLSLIDDLNDWCVFLDRLADEYQHDHLKLDGERFLSRVLVPGNSSVKISNLVTERLRR